MGLRGFKGEVGERGAPGKSASAGELCLNITGDKGEPGLRGEKGDDGLLVSNIFYFKAVIIIVTIAQ